MQVIDFAAEVLRKVVSPYTPIEPPQRLRALRRFLSQGFDHRPSAGRVRRERRS